MDAKNLPSEGNNEVSRQRFLFCANAGLLKHAVSEQYGGYGDGFRDLCQAHRALGRTSQDSGLILSVNAHLWGIVFPLLHYGTEQQKKHYLPNLLSGKFIGGLAITEPQAGSDLKALQTEAVYMDDSFLLQAVHIDKGYILNGHKRFISNAPIADCLVVYAKLENKLSAFIVHKDDPGVQFVDSHNVSGCATATMGEVIMEDTVIPLSRQLGKTGAGSMMIQYTLELERAFVFAGIAGIMDWQLDLIVKHSRERKVDGEPLGKKQAVSHKIAEMKLRLDSVYLWLHECARLKNNGKRITLASAQTKLFASEAFLQSSLDAVHILGAKGIARNSHISRLVNDAMASQLFSGSSEIQKNIIAALLGTGDGYNPK